MILVSGLVLTFIASACSGGNGGAGVADAGSASEVSGDSIGDVLESEVVDELAGAREFYEGNTITMLIPYGPGGGFDQYARFVAPLIAAELGANVVFENQGGAGSLLALNEHLVTGVGDGLTIAIAPGKGLGQTYLAGQRGMRFDLLEDISPVGRLSSAPGALFSGPSSDFETVQDVIDAGKFRFGATGAASGAAADAQLIITILGLTNADIVTGFDSSAEVDLSIVRGELDGVSNNVFASNPEGFRMLATLTPERLPYLPDVPTITEYELAEGGRGVVIAQNALAEIFRILLVRSDVPADRLAVLREAFDAVVNDPDVQSTAEEQGIPLFPLSGQEVEEFLVQGLSDVPQVYIDLLIALESN